LSYVKNALIYAVTSRPLKCVDDDDDLVCRTDDSSQVIVPFVGASTLSPSLLPLVVVDSRLCFNNTDLFSLDLWFRKTTVPSLFGL